MKRIVCGIVLLSAGLLVFSCSKNTASGNTDNSIHGKITGTITVLTNRTDVVDTKLQDYKDAFEKKYPGTSVEFEAISDYEGTVRTRMSTKEYGDVLNRPAIKTMDYEKYFEPLGKTIDFEKKFDFTNGSNPIDYHGTVYCYPVNGIVSGGVVYNKKVFEKAGVQVPRTTDEFYEDLEAIKSRTDAVPCFINYPAGWTLCQWEGGVTSFSGDPEYKNKIIHEDAPFVSGNAHYETYKMMYEVVKRHLCERDMLSSDWEQSKQMLADGKIGCMVLGSWAIPQIKNLADNPGDIGYMPMPVEVNGKKYAEASLDNTLCINKYSKNKATAYAWIRFFAEETDWVTFTESIPALKGGTYPSVLDSFKDMGVIYFETSRPTPEFEGVYDTLDKESEIGFWSEPEKKRIVDAAAGTSAETFDDIMNDWNVRWGRARKNEKIN